MIYNVNTIYPAFMGEVNKFGIGHPCVFVRLNGCNLKCYFAKLGTLCDTPEALSCEGGIGMFTEDIVDKVVILLGNSKEPLVCLTGGEPLLQDVSDLIRALNHRGINVAVETNGTKKILPQQGELLTFIVDYKSGTSGAKNSMCVENWQLMGKDDFLKFVIYNREDFEEFLVWYRKHSRKFKGTIAVGLFWNTPHVTYTELYRWLAEEQITCTLNMQTHKMGVLYDQTPQRDYLIPKDI